MDDFDRNLIRTMCQQFNILLEEIDEADGYTVFDLDGAIQIMPPSEDTNGKWAICRVHVRPGVHTLSNGDPGYPEEVDVEDVSSHDHCFQAVVEAVKLVVEIAANNISDALAMEQEFEEPQGEEAV